MGFFEFRRQLGYKAAQRGGMVVVADRWYPSSKMCSGCGHKLEALPLTVRAWTCPVCGSIHDRDVNAAINLKNMAVSSTVSVCGEVGSGSGCKTGTKPASVKQESSSKRPVGSFVWVWRNGCDVIFAPNDARLCRNRFAGSLNH